MLPARLPPQRPQHRPETVVILIAGALGKAVQILLLYPLDTIKVSEARKVRNLDNRA